MAYIYYRKSSSILLFLCLGIMSFGDIPFSTAAVVGERVFTVHVSAPKLGNYSMIVEF